MCFLFCSLYAIFESEYLGLKEGLKYVKVLFEVLNGFIIWFYMCAEKMKQHLEQKAFVLCCQRNGSCDCFCMLNALSVSIVHTVGTEASSQ